MGVSRHRVGRPRAAAATRFPQYPDERSPVVAALCAFYSRAAFHSQTGCGGGESGTGYNIASAPCRGMDAAVASLAGSAARDRNRGSHGCLRRPGECPMRHSGRRRRHGTGYRSRKPRNQGRSRYARHTTSRVAGTGPGTRRCRRRGRGRGILREPHVVAGS